MIFISGS